MSLMHKSWGPCVVTSQDFVLLENEEYIPCDAWACDSVKLLYFILFLSRAFRLLKHVSNIYFLILLLLLFLKIYGHNVHQSQSYLEEGIGSHCSSSSGLSGANEQAGRNSSANRSLVDIYNLPTPFISCVNKLCLATLDADGHCLEAQGSLRVLLEVM